MSWAVGYDERWKRDIGYGVPAYCDHPGCSHLIDRGLAHVCGYEPYGGEKGCGLYFCVNHAKTIHHLCDRCQSGAEPYPLKIDHPKWIKHKATHKSWAQWRKDQMNQPRR